MELLTQIDAIRTALDKRQIHRSEAAVRQGIVERLFRCLGWSTDNTSVVHPEYRVDNGKVDYALCYPDAKPIIFVEVKSLGNIDGGERQLFSYAVHEGVPILVLTDGQVWRFFYPAGQGKYQERQVCELDLTDGASEKTADILSRYLSYTAIQKGKVVQAIQDDYQRQHYQRQAAKHIPDAWHKLIEAADETLIEIIAETTEAACGCKPGNEQVLDFLKTLESLPTHQKSETTSRSPKRTKLVVTMPDGEIIQRPKIQNTFAAVIEKLGIERVKELNIKRAKGTPIVDTEKHPTFRQVQSGQYYIYVDQTTKDKRRDLRKIADGLGIELKVEILPI